MTESSETDPVLVVDDEDDRRRRVWLRRAIWAVLAAGVIAFLVRGANNPEDPSFAPENATSAEAAAEVGVDQQPAPITSPTPSTTPDPALPASPATSTTAGSEDAATGDPSTPGPAATPPSTGSGPTTPPTTDAARRPLAGFDEIGFRITAGSGAVTNGTALLADDPSSRGQGLMEQQDLRGYDAMVFRFADPSTGRFFMRNTRIPLSIAFFDTAGRFVSATDMEPCPDSVVDCPRYSADGPYLHAIEVAQGNLPGLGIGPGAVLSFPST